MGVALRRGYVATLTTGYDDSSETDEHPCLQIKFMFIWVEKIINSY